MKTVTIKLSDELYLKLNEEAERRHTTKSKLLREAVERSFSDTPAGSILEQIGDLVGTEEGPKDLSTNKRKYLEGYGN